MQNELNFSKVNIFFAYAREDKELRERLDKHLSTLKRQNFINTWYDGEIVAGKDWEKEINKALMAAEIILLLISVDFIASDYCYEIEMTKALHRHEKGESVIIPVILSPCDWLETPFSKLQALPFDGKPITKWEDKEEAFRITALGIKDRVIEIFNEKKRQIKSITELVNEKQEELRRSLNSLNDIKFEIEYLEEEIIELKDNKLVLESENIKIEKKKIEELSQTITYLSEKYKEEQIKYDSLIFEKKKIEDIIKSKLNSHKQEIEILSVQKGNLLSEVNNLKYQLQQLKS